LIFLLCRYESIIARSGKIGGMTSAPALDRLIAEQLRTLAAQLIQRVENLEQHVALPFGA
jgi:hypothetical protein